MITQQHGRQLALVGGSAGAGVACEVRVDGVQCRPAFRRGGQLREERGVARLEGRSHVTRVQAFWPAARQSWCLWPGGARHVPQTIANFGHKGSAESICALRYFTVNIAGC